MYISNNLYEYIQAVHCNRPLRVLMQLNLDKYLREFYVFRNKLDYLKPIGIHFQNWSNAPNLKPPERVWRLCV